MKDSFEKIKYYYLMIVFAFHLFSLGFCIYIPIFALSEGRVITSVITAIIIYPVTIFIFASAFSKK